jgi:hypothetical protein
MPRVLKGSEALSGGEGRSLWPHNMCNGLTETARDHRDLLATLRRTAMGRGRSYVPIPQYLPIRPPTPTGV